jgi:hypothetical protein
MSFGEENWLFPIFFVEEVVNNPPIGNEIFLPKSHIFIRKFALCSMMRMKKYMMET